MTCEELQPDYLLYAMGTMAEPESTELRAHLDRGCAACTEGLRQAQALAYSLGAGVDGPEPPRALRNRVLAISAPEQRRAPVFPWQQWALAAGIVVALLPGFFFYRELSESRALLAKEHLSSAAVPIFGLELERGASGEPLKQLAIPQGVNAIVLALPSDLVRQATSAELRNASGQTIWTAAPLPASAADSTGLTISAQLLPPGRYAIVLRAGNQPLVTLPFQTTF
jgi:hypothetical protein